MALAEADAGLAISGIYDIEPCRLNYLNEKLNMTVAEQVSLSPIIQLPAHSPSPVIAYADLSSVASGSQWPFFGFLVKMQPQTASAIIAAGQTTGNARRGEKKGPPNLAAPGLGDSGKESSPEQLYLSQPAERAPLSGSTVTVRGRRPMSALPPKADIDQHRCDVRFVPKADSCSATKNGLVDHLVSTHFDGSGQPET